RGYTFHPTQRDFVVDTLLANIASRGKGSGAAPKPGESEDPVVGRVSHPVLYRYKPVSNHQPGRFDLIGGSDLAILATGSSPGKVVERPPPGAGGAGAGAAGGSKRDGWKPLGNAATAAFQPREDPNKHLEGAEGKVKHVKGQTLRTEFIILF